MMSYRFTAIIEKDGDWWVAECPEVPGACAQGETKEKCLENLSEVTEMVLEHIREKATANLPDGALVEELV
ncbi:MAG: type II toxin-antitoxin system HicB family antitoxin [Verrucomicrobiota bacterium]